MRHRVITKKLGRDSAHRKALVFNLTKSLIENKGITTTVAKAKYIKPFVEKLVTRAKREQSLSNNRILLSRLNNKMGLVNTLVNEIAVKYKGRTGGFLSIQKTKKRDGDNSLQATISWVTVPDAPKKDEESKKPIAKVANEAKKISIKKKVSTKNKQK